MDANAVAGKSTAGDAGMLAGPGRGETRAQVPLLTEALFEGRFGDLHSPWTQLLGREIFRYRDGFSPAERSELAYERLRAVNDEIESVEKLIIETDRLVALHEWLGMVDGSLTTLATIHYNLFLGSLLELDPRHTVDLSPFTRLRRYGTVLITELGYGNNAAELETTAVYMPETDSFVLHTPSRDAQKFMPNTGSAGGPKSGLVAARLTVREQDCGVFLFLVPLRDERGPLPGIQVRRLSETPGSAVDHALTSFDRVTLPRTALLAGEHAILTDEGAFRSGIGSRRRRFLRSIQRVTTGKLCLSGAALGGARAAVTVAVRYAHRRHTFAPASRSGVPVFAYRCHQTRLLGAAARAYAATFLLREATRYCTGRDEAGTAEAGVLIAATKGWVTWRARDIVTECRERCGAQGLLSANRLVDLITPVESTVTAEGDNLVIWTKAAADMLMGRGYSPPVAPTARTGPPPGSSDGSPAGLPNGPLAGCASLLELLTRHELTRFQHARSHLARPSSSAMDRWNHAVNPALDLVDAYATRRAAEAFLASTARVDDDATRHLLEQVFHLFALQQLAPHTGLLLADGHLTAEEVRDLGPAVDRVGAALAPHALTLVAGFAIPDALLQAPIATDGYDAAYDDPAGPWLPAPG